VVTVKVAFVEPAATVKLAGTVAAAVLLLLRLTRAPPVGAGLSKVTVPVEELPPTRDAGLRLTEFRAAADDVKDETNISSTLKNQDVDIVYISRLIPPLV